MIGDDDRAGGKLTTRGTGPPSRRIGLRKYSGKLNLFCIETGISGKNALNRVARSCRGRDVIHRNTGALEYQFGIGGSIPTRRAIKSIT